MGESAVLVEGLGKVFTSRRRGDVTAVRDVSFRMEPGQIVGLLGANGAGKTTTIKCMCGLVRPTRGSILVAGHDVVADPSHAGERVAAVLEGNRNLYWRMTVRENIEFFAGLQGFPLRHVASQRDELVEFFGLSDKAKTPARMLSRGMQQKLALACALARRTPVLLLDEPTLGLDVETSYELRSYLRDLAGERTILLSSHDMDVVQEVCDRAVVIVAGQVVADDLVTNLLTRVRTQPYRILVSPLPSADAKHELEDRFPSIVLTPHDVGAQLDVTIAHEHGLTDLVDILRRCHLRLVAIDRNEPDLEDVFLHLTRQGAE
jgi:ABC-2 type transport system ATP-binding protein